jgi:parallel beta-helix repeat protein
VSINNISNSVHIVEVCYRRQVPYPLAGPRWRKKGVVVVVRSNYFGVFTALVASVAAGLIALLMTYTPAVAQATFNVDSTGDGSDVDLTDNICDADPDLSVTTCTLRAAIQQANNTSGADVIHFAIPSTGANNCDATSKVCTIRPGADGLPAIEEALLIDGYSQSGAKENDIPLAKDGTDAAPLIELDGTNTAGSDGVDGLAINTGAGSSVSDVEIKGLVINRFSGHGIRIEANSGTNSKVEGNFIGTDPSGTTAMGNFFGGVGAFSGNNTEVGGTTKAARNLISGNGNDSLLGLGVVFLVASDNKVEGNLIGTQKDGRSDLGNRGEGVLLTGSSSGTVGGADPSAANVIAFNGEDGVLDVSDSIGNRILGNSIFSNKFLGIDLNGDGRTANDPKDADTGPNNLQNFPTITSPVTTTTIKGTLNSLKKKTFTIQFFDNPPSEDEGKTFLGELTNVKTNRKGKASFTFTPPGGTLTAGDNVTATATNEATGDTSEFSDPVVVST